MLGHEEIKPDSESLSKYKGGRFCLRIYPLPFDHCQSAQFFEAAVKNENALEMLKSLSEDRDLAKKICRMDKAELIAAAKELDVELTEADFVRPEGEISDDDLEAISGGGECQCYLCGGGTKAKHGQYPACGCVLAGVRKDWDGDYDRCYCALGGYGDA